MLLTPYGLRVWLPILLLTIAAVGILVSLGWWPLALIVAIVGGALLSFFRDPIRTVPSDLPAEVMLSPADGTVTAVLDLDSHQATGGAPAKLVRIFLSVLNVHINRSPCDAQVVSLRHSPGKFLNAQTEESAAVNECNLIVLRIATGETLGVRQVVGMLARTIVCPLKPGDKLQRGQKFGMIKFGSTTELILPRPSDVEVHVAKGDTVKAGLTKLATLSPPSPQNSPGRAGG